MTPRAGNPEDDTRTTARGGAVPPLPSARFVAGTVLASRYRVVGLLGRGGMGEVYRADDLRLGQAVALKFLPEGVAADPVRLARFHNEVRVARQVSHPHVCRVHDIGEADGLPFLSMEYVEGEDLASLLRRVGHLPRNRALAVARQICAGLAAAHDRGVLHRDLKPANIMIDGQGHARLTDFGLAGAVGEVGTGEVAGTPAYMPPEQIDGRQVTTRSDIYALGLVLYELFTGQGAFRADSLARILEMQRTAQPVPPSAHVPELEPFVERVILRCLEKDPARRPASARAVAAALGGADALEAVVAAGETPSPEMVAAAGEEGALTPRLVVGAFALAVAFWTLSLFLCDRGMLFNQIPFESPPEALAERARELIGKTGHRTEGTAHAMGFDFDRRVLDYIEKHDASPSRWTRLSSGQPAAAFFWYRQAPGRLRPVHPFGRVTRSDPPSGQPGMVSLRLDTRGRLLEFEASPPETSAAAEKADAPDWSAFFAAASVDPRQLRVVAPARTPPAFADSRAAWEGVFPERPDLPLRVEAAALGGRPVSFRLLGPWDEPHEPAPALTGAGGFGPFAVLLLPVLFLGSLLLVRRNLGKGRGDRQGAFRLAVVEFAARLLFWLFGTDHQPSSPGWEWALFQHGLAHALYFAAWMWVLYLALEPYVRRRWPDALISWSRLLSGRFRDPLVGRDLLVGTLLLGAIMIVGHAAIALSAAPNWRQPIDLDQLLGPRDFLAALGGAVAMGILAGMLMLLVLLVLRVVTRRPALAAAGFVLLWTAVVVGDLRVAGSPLLVLAVASWVSLLVLSLTRFGLLPVVVVWFVSFLATPLTARWSAWYSQSSVLATVVVIGLAGFGAYAALRGRPLLEEWLESA